MNFAFNVALLNEKTTVGQEEQVSVGRFVPAGPEDIARRSAGEG